VERGVVCEQAPDDHEPNQPCRRAHPGLRAGTQKDPDPAKAAVRRYTDAIVEERQPKTETPTELQAPIKRLLLRPVRLEKPRFCPRVPRRRDQERPPVLSQKTQVVPRGPKFPQRLSQLRPKFL
jgi:hypothetical protein